MTDKLCSKDGKFEQEQKMAASLGCSTPLKIALTQALSAVNFVMRRLHAKLLRTSEDKVATSWMFNNSRQILLLHSACHLCFLPRCNCNSLPPNPSSGPRLLLMS